MIVSGTKYAELRGRSPGWVTQQIAAGMPVEVAGKRGTPCQIDVGKALDWEITRAIEKTEAANGGEHGRLLRAQAEKVEIFNAQRRRELVSVAFVEAIFHGMAADITARLDAIGPRLASEFAVPTSPEKVIARVRIETDGVRTGVDEYFKKLAESPPPDALDEVAAIVPKPSGRKGRQPRSKRR